MRRPRCRPPAHGPAYGKSDPKSTRRDRLPARRLQSDTTTWQHPSETPGERNLVSTPWPMFRPLPARKMPPCSQPTAGARLPCRHKRSARESIAMVPPALRRVKSSTLSLTQGTGWYGSRRAGAARFGPTLWRPCKTLAALRLCSNTASACKNLRKRDDASTRLPSHRRGTPERRCVDRAAGLGCAWNPASRPFVAEAGLLADGAWTR